MVDSKKETLAIPAAVRAAVLERDSSNCRLCGSHAAEPAIHHIKYRSQGGRNVASNLITVHWMFAPRCHELIHSNKGLWQPLAFAVVDRPGITMLQLLRWSEKEKR